jgi:hypothetical protein
MPSSRTRIAAGAGFVTIVTILAGAPAPRLDAQTDLDSFMKAVVVRRDDNWKKLQQYILDERQEMILNGPGNARLWGEQRDYTWFIRDGFFVRSPVRVDGATVGEDDRRKAEDQYLRRTQRRDARASTGSGQAARGGENAPPDSGGVGAVARPDNNDNSSNSPDAPANVDGLIRQMRQPQFVSSSYFLRFKFDEGRYALAGREKFEGRDVLKVEYYPTKLFDDDNRRRRGGSNESARERQQEADLRRLMNKVALITLWIDPSSHQIVRYTFDNIDFDFLPAAWLVKVDSLKASMTMSQPFQEVWLPRDIDIQAAVTTAIGQFSFRQAVNYHDYREANVATKVFIPGADRAPRKR